MSSDIVISPTYMSEEPDPYWIQWKCTYLFWLRMVVQSFDPRHCGSKTMFTAFEKNG